MKSHRLFGLLAAVALVVAACGGGDAGQSDTTVDDAATTTTEAPSTTEAPTTTEAPATTDAPATTSGDDDTSSDMEGVHVSESELGEILVGPEGFTLYVFTNDSEGESVCYDQCAQTWPPVPADTLIGSDLDASLFGSATRDDGTEQLTVNGMPLYWYQADLEPGDVNGQGFSDVWFVVDVSGSMVQSAEGGSEDTTDDSVIDYDY